MSDRKMPNKIDLGRSFSSTMAQCMGQQKNFIEKTYGDPNPLNLRSVMGYLLPTWQRGFVWTEQQKISFIESAWLGINLGTYTYNQTNLAGPLDNLLIDGQQRMRAIECYLNDEFRVFGWKWSEITDVDRRVWAMTTMFASYITNTEDEDYLKGYYNMSNFGGTSHKESERA